MRLRSWFSGSSLLEGAVVTPTTNGSWTAGSSSTSRRLMPWKSSAAGGVVTEAFTAGQTKDTRTYVMDRPLRAGPFGGKVWCYVPGNESNADDNVSSRLEVYIVSADFSTVRGTLLSVGSYGSGAELSTTQRGIAFADGDTMSTVTAQAGDRVVVRIGGADTSGTTPSISLYFGGTEADCLEDESTTGNQAGWIDFEQGEAFLDVPVFVGLFSTPADNGTNTADPTAVDPTTGATLKAGDLLVLVPQYRGANPALPIQVDGGQFWRSAAASVSNTNIGARCWWARYNGTWTANPSVDYPGTNCNSLYLMVFRPSQNTMLWGIDQALVELDFTAGSTPFTKTITGQTTTKANTVTVAGWFSADDNTWSTLAGGGWLVPKAEPGGFHFRNTSGSQMSAAFAYKIQAVAGATGNVSMNQATLGGDAGTTFIVSFYEYPATASPIGAPTTHENGTFGDTGNVTTGSKTPTANALQVLVIAQGTGFLTDPVTAVSGCGITWSEVGPSGGVVVDLHRLQIFTGLSASPSTGTLTITVGDERVDGAYSWYEFPGVNRVSPVGFSASIDDPSPSVNPLVISSIGGVRPNSACFAAWTQDYGFTSYIPRTGWIELDEYGGAGGSTSYATHYTLVADDVASVTNANTNSAGGIVFEIRAELFPASTHLLYPTAAIKAATW